MTNEKYISDAPPLTAHEQELITILNEECGEIIADCMDIVNSCLAAMKCGSKLARFGLAEVKPGQELTNTQRLSLEIGDLMCVIEKCLDAGILDEEWIDKGVANKTLQLAKYMQTKE